MEAGRPMTAQSQSLHSDGLCRLIGEVNQDCNLTIKYGQEARGRRKWFWVRFPKARFPFQIPLK